jgi:hypothetical protein
LLPCKKVCNGVVLPYFSILKIKTMKPERAIPESLRTVVFTEEAAFIPKIMGSLDVDAAVGSLEEITQILLNATNEIRHDIGDHYFLLRQLREFHAIFINRLAPVGEAYWKAFTNGSGF